MDSQIFVDFLVCFAASLAACFIACGLVLTAWMAIFNSMLRYALDIVKLQYAAGKSEAAPSPEKDAP